jgi:hypothetical protein
MLSACGGSASSGGPCAGTHTGDYAGSGHPDKVSLDGTCNFSYTGDDSCTSSGTYTSPQGAATATVQVSIQTSSGGACLPVGIYNCPYALNGNLLSFGCGAGVRNYTR